ncbi:MAG TPA: PQQ-binding-like beta-propeller repeat protein [Thermoplasmata archaeon]|nr:PQQ-binding-like beta-propeller repeat protein [Thermoplasmata archaeon]
MRLSPVLAVLLVAVCAGAPAASLSVRAAPGTPIGARFLFDFGDGTYAWSNATIARPDASNASWNATRDAATQAGVAVAWGWSPSFGIYIVGLGSAPGLVGLYLWNRTTTEWDELLVGISSLVLRDGDVLAISQVGFDPVTYAPLYPVPTPLSPYPVQEFRGDLANTGASASRAPGSLAVRWDRDLHLREIASSPAVAFGRVYILTMDGLFAINEATGGVAWSNPSIRGLSTPAVFNGTLLLGGSDGRLHAVDASSGADLWNVTLVEHPQFSGITSSPKLWLGTAYVGTFNETGGPGEVVALWATNGTIRWRHTAFGSVSFSSPALSNGFLLVGVIGRYNTTTQVTYDPPYGLLSLDATTGSPRWFYRTNASVAASPLVTGSEVVVPAKNGFVYALNATTMALLWKANVAAGVSSPALVGSRIVVGGGSLGTGGRVTALDLATGSVVWSFIPNGPVQTSVAAADGKVFFATNVANGTVYALNGSTGGLLWSYTPSPAQYIFGSPVVADGYLLAPSDNGHLYAFQEAAPVAPSGLPWVPITFAVLVVVVALVLTLWIVRRRRHAP